MLEFLDQTLFVIGDNEISVRAFILFLIFLGSWILIYRLVAVRLLNRFFERSDTTKRLRKRMRISLFMIFVTVIAIAVLILFDIDYGVQITPDYVLTILTVVKAILIFEIAQILDWILARTMLKRVFPDKEKETERRPFDPKLESPGRTARQAVRYTIYALALLFVIENFNITYGFTILQGSDMEKTILISEILYVIFLFLLARVGVWVFTNLIMSGYYERRGVAKGSQFAINQLIKYVVYVVTALVALQILGFNLSLVLGGLAALLVGVGLGLQTTFNDLASGIILLFERSIEIGHVIEVQGMVGVVQRIGLRASLVETRENIVVVVPNSMMVHEKVINWSQVDNKAMFKIEVGVAYGSDTALVKQLLLEAAKSNDYVLDYPHPFVRFTNFGDSSLVFQVLFWSKHFMIIENIRSDIRFEIDKLFRANNVRIPFPQRDVHFYPTDQSK